MVTMYCHIRFVRLDYVDFRMYSSLGGSIAVL
jgi:hypothetical protein